MKTIILITIALTNVAYQGGLPEEDSIDIPIVDFPIDLCDPDDEDCAEKELRSQQAEARCREFLHRRKRSEMGEGFRVNI